MGRKRKTDPAKLAELVTRVKSGEITLSAAAVEAGIAVSAMHTAVNRIEGVPLPSAPEDPSTTSPLERALDAAGVGGPEEKQAPPGSSAPPPLPTVSDGDYCVQTVGALKKIVVMGGGLVMKINLLDDRLTKLGDLGKDAKKACEVASPELAPILRKWLPEGSVLLGLAVALMFDALGTYMGMKTLALEAKQKRLEKEAKEEKTVESAVEDAPPPGTNGSNRESWMSKIRGG